MAPIYELKKQKYRCTIQYATKLEGRRWGTYGHYRSVARAVITAWWLNRTDTYYYRVVEFDED